MADTSWMARVGARLVTIGYAILPIAPGTKKPRFSPARPGTALRAFIRCVGMLRTAINDEDTPDEFASDPRTRGR